MATPIEKPTTLQAAGQPPKLIEEFIGSIQPGRYRHYKGKDYTVIGVARHSETEEELVVYRQEYDDHGLWVRPLAVFLETVEVEGRAVPRFQYLGPD